VTGALGVRGALARVRGEWRHLRVQRWVTAWLGPRYRRSRTRIELDVTWACDLRCANCNRSCEQAPTGEGMTVAQVARFVDDSLARGQRWERIRILGGEPTLHPDLDAILAELARYRSAVPDVVVELATHGHGPRVRAVLARLPGWVRVDDSHKDGPAPAFETFNVAPVDRAEYASADFRNACPVTQACGMGLGPNGYYACAVAGAIDRVLSDGALGRSTLPAADDDLHDQLAPLCAMCGHFKRRPEPLVRETVRSPSWDRAYARWHAQRRSPSRRGLREAGSPPGGRVR
jgi:hypothetical protein